MKSAGRVGRYPKEPRIDWRRQGLGAIVAGGVRAEKQKDPS